MSRPRQHGEPKPDSPRQAPLYDDNVATPSHAEQARTLLERLDAGVLCTAAADLDAHPYGSLVIYALHDDDPILLISELAEHTKNLRASARCSLVVHERGPDNPLALSRATLVGRATQVESEQQAAVAEAFLARHPAAEYYADFEDFAYWRIAVDSVRYIGGFGRMSWVEPSAWSQAQPDPLMADAKRIIDHMNEDHADALRLYSEAFSRSGPVAEAVMTGVDRYGFEMSVSTDHGPRPVRIAFEGPVDSATEVRQAMVAMLEQARATLSG